MFLFGQNPSYLPSNKILDIFSSLILNVLCAGSSAVEQEPFKLVAVGSIPTQRTNIKIPCLWDFYVKSLT